MRNFKNDAKTLIKGCESGIVGTENGLLIVGDEMEIALIFEKIVDQLKEGLGKEKLESYFKFAIADDEEKKKINEEMLKEILDKLFGGENDGEKK
jgi:hypothetical protein